MEDRSQASAGNSRKRIRSDDRSGSPYKLSTSPAMSHVRESRPRSGSASGPSEVMLTTSAESAPMLQPLHPPIPNFSAISQGAPRPNSVPTSNNDPPNNMIYNIALPLPNPGRAHRFCQACDHINHVRRKLCENCGAPKPSAVRNAVGVRSSNDDGSSKDRRVRPTAPETYFDGLGQGYPRSTTYAQSPGQSVYSRPASHTILPTDQRGNKSVDPIIHQAHPIQIRGPGDDMPLLGNTQRTHPSYQFSDSQASQRMGIGQAHALLSEPLINFGAVHNQDPRQQRPHVRNIGSGAADFSQKVFPGYALDRDQIGLPSMNGLPGQQQPQVAYPVQTGPPRRASQLDLSSQATGLPHPGKGSDGTLTEDVILGRNNFIPELDARQGPSRFQNLQGLRQGQDLFQPHSQVRPEDRITFDESRSRDGLGSSDPVTGSKPNINLTRYMEHNAEGMQRNGDDRGRVSQGIATNRGEVLHTGQLHRVPEQPSSSHFDESARQTEEGRFAIENILMQHKSGRSNQG